jgi:hypothetical protein
MGRTIKAPGDLIYGGRAIFLAGSIEMGWAEDWQSYVENALTDTIVTILNPRRDDWDASWTQSIDNQQFRQQVEWELSALTEADIIAMYFSPATKSPITLLELGLFGRTGKVIVCCPEGFWRKGNVDVVCAKYGIAQVTSLDELVSAVKSKLSEIWF